MLIRINNVTLTVTVKNFMSASTKLSSSVKALYFLSNQDKPRNSSEIAMATGINASKLRRLLSMLGKNGIVKSDNGVRGGFMLNKQPDQIHLQEIYCAIEDRKAFYLNVNRENLSGNTNSKKINSYFLNLFSEIQVDIEDKMKSITLKTIIDNII